MVIWRTPGNLRKDAEIKRKEAASQYREAKIKEEAAKEAARKASQSPPPKDKYSFF